MSMAVPEASLSALFHILADQALLAMGVQHPMMKEQPPANPQVAKFFLDLLALVKDKTEGRLSSAESQELKGLLHQLRMRSLGANPTDSQGA
jgi:hypothetical protein